MKYSTNSSDKKYYRHNYSLDQYTEYALHEIGYGNRQSVWYTARIRQ